MNAIDYLSLPLEPDHVGEDAQALAERTPGEAENIVRAFTCVTEPVDEAAGG